MIFAPLNTTKQIYKQKYTNSRVRSKSWNSSHDIALEIVGGKIFQMTGNKWAENKSEMDWLLETVH